MVPGMRGAFAGAIVTVLLCCAPASALDPVCSTQTLNGATQTDCSIATPVATVSCSRYDSTVNPPHESTIDSCAVDSSAATASCTSDQESGGDDPSTSACTAAAGGATVDCTRYETYVYVSNDDVGCTTSTASGDTATCETDHTNDFFVTGDSSRTTGCALDPAAGDTTACNVTTQPDTDPIDPAFPAPDGSDPAITPGASCPAP
jgi:hypothetical protein